MNRPLRRLSAVIAFLFFTLFASTTWIQFLRAGELNAMPGNSRQLYAELGRERGPILVGAGQTVASSVEVQDPDDPYRYLRQYAAGELYAPVTGHYSIRYGTSGVERALNDVLSGTADELFYRRLSDLITGRDPRGGSVTLTLRPEVQQAAWDALDGRKGAVVALDPSTGDVLAMVSSPSYDPSVLATHDGAAAEQAWQALLGDEDDPMVNRATGALYPPGSTFKLVTAAAALESGDYDADTLVAGPRELDLPQTSNTLGNDEGTACGPDDRVSLRDALRISCNTAFGDLGLRLGAEALDEQARAFGFEQPLSTPLPVTQSRFPEDAAGPLLAYAGIGQGDVTATPLQVAMLSAGIANDGVVMRPNLVADVRDAAFDVVEDPAPQELGRAVSEETAATLREMMRAVVESGTGTRARIEGVTVGGKTGTAQRGGGRAPYAWFTSWADDGQGRNQRVAVAVVIEDGGSVDSAYGGRLSAPVAQRVMQAALDG
ncbi:penicillin-binding transpeptidase domain-containing protein [Kineococcus gypseus]|uniref:peptidoglycan D,D-transpeptidase FtsI family protein n=1 Tax=Kineococcus gypseus TaxID=1637102 RepID=UPI003D7DDE3B